MSSSMSDPVNVDPPLAVKPLDDAGDAFSDPWVAYFLALTDRLNAAYLPVSPSAPGTGIILQTGTSTSDPAGLISVTLPAPFTARTLSFQVDARPTEPDAIFDQGTVVSLPLDVITGLLGKDDGSGGILPVANTDFTWFATGV